MTHSKPCSSAQRLKGICNSTGKERDTETNLDYFGARYYASNMGRMLSPDPDQASGFDHMGDPQSWNGYAYARNNPLTYTDPDGQNYQVCDQGGKNCADLTNEQYEQWRKDNSNIHADSGGNLTFTNTDGSETKAGSASYYNEKDSQAAAMIGYGGENFIKAFMIRSVRDGVTGGVLGFAAGEFTGGLIEGLSGTASGSRSVLGLEGAAEAANAQRKIAGVLKQVDQGTTKGKVFDNLDGRLPPGNYREYTVPSNGGGRGAERVVVDQTTGSAYYSPNHYGRFIQVR